MDIWHVLIIILGIALALFLLLAITLTIIGIKVILQIRRVTKTAERIALRFETVADSLAKVAVPSLLSKVFAERLGHFMKKEKTTKEKED